MIFFFKYTFLKYINNGIEITANQKGVWAVLSANARQLRLNM